jgi:hypothetical protein
MTSRIPLGSLRDRFTLYEEGLIAGGHPLEMRERLLRDVAVWRHVYLAESQAQAEDELSAALRHTRRHMLHARSAHNPEDYRVDPAVVNAFNDPSVPEDEAVRQSMAAGALYGTARQVAERLAELRDAGVRHVLCQMSFGYLGHERIVDSMRRFGEHVFRLPLEILREPVQDDPEALERRACPSASRASSEGTNTTSRRAS